MSLPAEPAVLASDADRDGAARVLTEAFADGRLTAAEHGDRVHAVHAARTWPELAELTADLPAAASPAAARKRRRPTSAEVNGPGDRRAREKMPGPVPLIVSRKLVASRFGRK